MKWIFSLSLRSVVFSLAIIAGCIPIASAQVTQGALSRISTGPGDLTPDGDAGSPVASDTGRYIAFHSTASNIVPNDVNFSRDVFVRDLQTNSTIRVSVNQQGEGGDSDSRDPSITAVGADGLYGVAFSSTASNLDPTVLDTNDGDDIFMHLPALNITRMVSRAVGGLESADNRSITPSVVSVPNQNRFIVAYASDASNISGSHTNNEGDVYVATVTYSGLTTGTPSATTTTERISRAFQVGQETDGDSINPKVSGNGRFVVFQSRATNIVPGTVVPNPVFQIYLYDLGKGSVRLVSQTAAGVPGDGPSFDPSISYSGRYITYITQATNLDPQAGGAGRYVLRHDVSTNTTELVSKNASGTIGNGSALDARVSPSGRFVVFSDSSTNLIAGDVNGSEDVFIRDMETGALTLASVSRFGLPAGGRSSNGSLVANGYNGLNASISFLSDAPDIVLNDVTGPDVYAASGTIPPPPLTEDTVLEVPPDVVVRGQRARLSFQSFQILPDPTPSPLMNSPSSFVAGVRTSAEDEVRYEYRIRGPRGRRIDNARRLTKRNTTTVRRLPPGKYNARYRVVTNRNGTRVRATRFSPAQRFQVRRRQSA